MLDEDVSNLEVQAILLDIFSTWTGLPIGLFDLRNQHDVFGEASLRCFEPYCQRIHELPGGRGRCQRDEWRRVRASPKGGLTLCHAGLYNYSLPVSIDGELVATLLCGEMRIEGVQFEQNSQAQHQRFLQEGEFAPQLQDELRTLFDHTKRLPLHKVETEVLTDLHKIEEWYFDLLSSQQALTRQTEDLTHNLQIYLQALLARAENFLVDLERDRDVRREYKDSAQEILNSTIALDTVIQRLGDFRRGYRFEKVRLAKLLHQSRRLYLEEAKRRGVSIKMTLEPVDGSTPVVEASAEQLQKAFHNLVHNAVKYSFSGAYDRPRWVEILGRPRGRYYEVRIQNFGVGIDPDEYDRIFAGGYQGRRTRAEYRPGSGQGLPYVKRVVDRHHGKVLVTSVNQKSAFLTTFAVLLPYSQAGWEDVDEQ
jgi:signal transduction histidine kinase